MSMNIGSLCRLMMLAVVLSGCAPMPTAVVTPSASAPTPSKTEAGLTITASAAVVPAVQAQMAFLISAPIKEILVKEGEAVHAGQALIRLDTPDLDFAVKAAEAAVRAAQAEVNRMNTAYKRVFQGDRFVYVRAPLERREQAQARLEAAQAALDAARAAQAQDTLIAPFDGVVVAIHVEPGELVQPHQPVLVIGDLQHLQIETTDLSERQVFHVHIGQKARVRFKAFDQDFPATVITVAPKGERVGGDVVYRVRLVLDSQPPGLRWGMSAEVEIDVQG